MPAASTTRLPVLQSLDVIATRLFFDRPVATKYPANVLSGFEPAAGATFFNLNELQVGQIMHSVQFVGCHSSYEVQPVMVWP